MANLPWYQELFKNTAQEYEKLPFVKATAGEVDFIEEEIRFSKGSRVLDLACGTGRHSLELARRGYFEGSKHFGYNSGSGVEPWGLKCGWLGNERFRWHRHWPYTLEFQN